MKCQCLFSVILLACAASAAQDDKPALPLPPVPGGAAPATSAKTPELKPGAVPLDTKPDALLLLNRVRTAGPPPQTDGKPPVERAPVTAFDLSIDLRYKATDAQSNDMPAAHYTWLAPNFLRADSGRGMIWLRGPKGSFAIDSSKGEHPEPIPIDVGRDTLEDRRKLEEISGLAGNFARLTDPRALRIARPP